MCKCDIEVGQPCSASLCDVCGSGHRLQVQKLPAHQPPARRVLSQTSAVLYHPSAGIRVQTPSTDSPPNNHQERPQGKRVAFADSKGLSLITVRLFSEKEEKIACEPLPRLKKLNRVLETSRLRLGFDEPCVDFQAFRSRLQENMVLLESCKVTKRSVLGTVRVRNVCFEKAVHIRVTFDTWRSYRDVPCTYLDQRYGEPGTDVFEFNITVPEQMDSRGRIEFCVSYLPCGFSDAVWDNNYGRNYCIHVCDT